MTRGVTLLALVLAVAACTENTAPGNDREAELDPPAPAAAMASPGAALQGVATGLLMPEIMTAADRSALAGNGGPCLFRMTRVGMPVMVYGPSAVIKLNGKLIPLPRTGAEAGAYSGDGVSVTVRPLDGGEPGPELVDAEMVLRLPGAPDELGFHGFAACGGTPAA